MKNLKNALLLKQLYRLKQLGYLYTSVVPFKEEEPAAAIKKKKSKTPKDDSSDNGVKEEKESEKETKSDGDLKEGDRKEELT